MKDQLYKFIEIDEIDLSLLSNETTYHVKRFGDNSADSYDGETIKRNVKHYSITEILLPIESQEVSDIELEKEADERFIDSETNYPQQCFEDGAKWLRSQMTAKSDAVEWIKVEERLPENRKIVLIFWNYEGKDRITSGSYNCTSKGNEYWAHGAATQLRVTHWKPLPNPPTK